MSIKISGTIIHNLDSSRKPKEIKFTENDLLNYMITYCDKQTKISLVIEVDGENWQFTQDNIQDLQMIKNVNGVEK